MLVVAVVVLRYVLRCFGFFFRDSFSKKEQLGQVESELSWGSAGYLETPHFMGVRVAKR